jgi:hypothetical protein
MFPPVFPSLHFSLFLELFFNALALMLLPYYPLSHYKKQPKRMEEPLRKSNFSPMDSQEAVHSPVELML